jgi:hypothetical protein
VNLTWIRLASPFINVIMWDRCPPKVGKEHDRQRLSLERRSYSTPARMLGLLLLSVAGLGGCHTSASFLDNSQFMEAWKTYLHCRASGEPDEIGADLQRLRTVSSRHAQSLQNHSSLVVLPVAMRSLVAMLPSRVAVDPHAMTVACALHGDHVAQSAGRPELAVELFGTVWEAQRGASYAYDAAEIRRKFHPIE